MIANIKKGERKIKYSVALAHPCEAVEDLCTAATDGTPCRSRLLVDGNGRGHRRGHLAPMYAWRASVGEGGDHAGTRSVERAGTLVRAVSAVSLHWAAPLMPPQFAPGLALGRKIHYHIVMSVGIGGMWRRNSAHVVRRSRGRSPHGHFHRRGSMVLHPWRCLVDRRRDGEVTSLRAVHILSRAGARRLRKTNRRQDGISVCARRRALELVVPQNGLANTAAVVGGRRSQSVVGQIPELCSRTG